MSFIALTRGYEIFKITRPRTKPSQTVDPPTERVVRRNKRADLCDNAKVRAYVYLKLCSTRTINFFKISFQNVQRARGKSPFFLDPSEMSNTNVKYAKCKKKKRTDLEKLKIRTAARHIRGTNQIHFKAIELFYLYNGRGRRYSGSGTVGGRKSETVKQAVRNSRAFQ